MKTFGPSRALFTLSVTLTIACGIKVIRTFAAGPGMGASAAALFPVPQGMDPVVNSVSPSQAAPGSEGVLKIIGRNFPDGAIVSFWNPGIQVLDTNVLSSTEITVHVRIAGDAAPGATTLSVSTPDGHVGQATFTVTGSKLPPAITPNLPSTNLALGLMAWWKFEEGNGNVAYDSAGNGNSGTLIGNVTWDVGRIGGALRFDGVNAYVNTGLDVQPGAMPSTTWLAWVFPTRVNFHERQFALSINAGGEARSVFVAADQARWGIFTGTEEVWHPGSVDVNQWQHIAVVYTPTNIEFYKNGVRSSWGHKPKAQGSRFGLQIGRNPGFGGFYQGLIDDVRVYNRALSPDEVMAIFKLSVAQ